MVATTKSRSTTATTTTSIPRSTAPTTTNIVSPTTTTSPTTMTATNVAYDLADAMWDLSSRPSLGKITGRGNKMK